MLKMAALAGIFLFAAFSFAFSAPLDKRLQALTDTLSAIERLVRYYKSTYRDLNLDGLFGLRVLEGQFDGILEEFNTVGNGGLSNDITARIRYLKVEATNISETAVDFVKRGDEEYYRNLHFVVGHPWKLWKSQRFLNFSTHWDHKVYLENKEKLTESKSDRCMAQLTGSLKKNSTVGKCQISADCIQLMTSRGLTGYGITHQILWSMLSEQAGCLTVMASLFKKLGSSLEDFQTEFCTNNFLEMIQTVHTVLQGKITPRFQDLFLEQQFICPNIGFHEFLSSNYLSEILSWQKDSGCYGTMPRRRNSGSRGDFEYDYEENAQRGDKALQIPGSRNVRFNSLNPDNISREGVVVQRGQKLVQQVPVQDIRRENVEHPAIIANSYQEKPVQRGLLSLADRKTFRSRRLMAEKALPGGCLAHKTAVAAGALIMYLRYLIHPGQSNIFNNNAFIKSKVSAIKPLTDNEDVAYALAMGQSLSEMPKGAAGNSVRKTGDLSIKANRTLLKKDYSHPLNNNVLAAQLYGKNNKDEYYSNQKLKEDYYEDKNEAPEYPKHDNNKLNSGHKRVHFDNKREDNRDYVDEDYRDDGYDEKDEEKEDEGKNEDRDYPYYDNNQRKQREEADRIEREDKDQYLVKPGEPQNPAGGIEGGEKPGPSIRTEGPSLVSVILSFSVVFCVLLFFVYRFIRTRRVHIRYKLKSLMRL